MHNTVDTPIQLERVIYDSCEQAQQEHPRFRRTLAQKVWKVVLDQAAWAAEEFQKNPPSSGPKHSLEFTEAQLRFRILETLEERLKDQIYDPYEDGRAVEKTPFTNENWSCFVSWLSRRVGEITSDIVTDHKNQYALVPGEAKWLSGV